MNHVFIPASNDNKFSRTYLLLHIGDRAAQQFNKQRHSSSLNDKLRLSRGSGCNVGQSPGSLKLDEGKGCGYMALEFPVVKTVK